MKLKNEVSSCEIGGGVKSSLWFQSFLENAD